MFRIQLRVGQRLGLGFGLMLALLCAACLTAIWRLHSIGEINQRLIDIEWRKAEAAALVDATTRANARHAMALLFLEDGAQMAAVREAMDRNKLRIDESLATLDALVVRPEARTLLQDIRTRRQHFVASFMKVRQLLQAGQREQAVTAMRADTLPAIAALEQPMQDLNALQKRIVIESGRKVQDDVASSVYLMWGLSAVALLCGAIAAHLITRSVTAPVSDAVALARRVARGDLTATVHDHAHDELGELLDTLQEMNGNLARIVGHVRQGSETISTATSQIAVGNLDLSQRTEQQASSLQQIAASLHQLTSTVQHNLDSGRHANQVASSAAEVAQRGGAVVSQVVQTMEAINASSRKIADIIGVIDGIAFQTNILALNAAVEAARAGEQGRGFAVVAAEVRSLASRSATAAREIKSLIGRSVSDVEQGCKLVEDAGGTMTQIVQSVRQVADIMGELADAASEQSQGISQINDAMGQMDQVTQGNAALVEEAAAAAKSLEQQAHSLVQSVDVFRLSGAAA
ncbi:MAG: methyl-accepting chemotaxis protein [Aquabacterium sp.]